MNPQDLERTWCVESRIHLGLLPMEERGWEVQTWELTWKSTHCFVLTHSKQAFFLIFGVVCFLVLHLLVPSCLSLTYCAPSLPFYQYPHNTSMCVCAADLAEGWALLDWRAEWVAWLVPSQVCGGPWWEEQELLICRGRCREWNGHWPRQGHVSFIASGGFIIVCVTHLW